MVRLREHYEKIVRPDLLKRLNYGNVHAVPRIEKVVLNMGIGEGAHDQKRLTAAFDDLRLIAGQHPVKTLAKRSVAAFRTRAGMAIGAKVTLRRDRMYEFIDRLVTIAMPRVRDFRGLSPKSFDGHGNYSLGIKEHIIFPEVVYEKVDHVVGMDIVFVTTAQTDQEGLELLKGFGLPFVQQKKESRAHG